MVSERLSHTSDQVEQRYRSAGSRTCPQVIATPSGMFRHSGMQPRSFGELPVTGISKAGDPDVRRALYEAPSAMPDALKGQDGAQELGPEDRQALPQEGGGGGGPQARGHHARDVAEREGFEPSVPRKRDNGFRDRPVRPLRHLSVPSGCMPCSTER